MPELRIHIQKNLFTCVLKGEFLLLLCKGGLSNLMTLLSPIPRLPGKQRANETYVLWEEIDIYWSGIACLDGDIGDVMRLLALDLHLSLMLAIVRNLHFRTVCQRSRPSCGKDNLFGESRGNRFDRKLCLDPAP